MSAPTEKRAKIGGGQPAALHLRWGDALGRAQAETNARVRVGPQVIEIPIDAFRDCKKLIGLQFNEGLKVIGGCSFEGCTSLRSVTLPSTVTAIHDGAFLDC